MSLVSLVASCQQMLGFASTASLVGSGEKLDTDSRIGQLACCGLCQEFFFLGAMTLLNSVGDCVKGCHVCGLFARSIHGVYVDWRGKRTCRVDRVFSCRVYIDSNHHNSQRRVTTCSQLPSSSNLLD
jgi:hypothetical protein